ncbi:unnamed protein product [Clonostachys byssicola]|uniref:F-box domain-containing protein n=1 Tax=Clonostachys byssicola TaxID=160290 RepID=A0A9N9UU91_9HYPO|nr:unnamed protein product [Clonostachys byssicola]
MPARTMQDCPRELQLAIFTLLPSGDLLSLSLVSKNLHGFVEPLLVADIHLEWKKQPDHKLPPVAALLRTLLERPYLGQHCLKLRLTGMGFKTHPRGTDEEPPALPVSVLPLPAAAEHIRVIEAPGADNWLEELQAGAVDALVALLISMLPNLISLELGPNFTLESACLGKFLRHATTCVGNRSRWLPKFPSLKHVVFAGRTNEFRHCDFNNAADVLPFFYLPSLQTMSVSIDNPVTWTWPHSDSAMPLLTSSLTSLELFRLRETRLEHLLTPLKSLKKLHWHWFYQEHLDSHASTDIVALDVMAHALCQVHGTLMELTIEADTEANELYGEYEDPDVQTRGSLRGLAQLAQLKLLRIPWAFLIGLSPEEAPGKITHLGASLPSGLEVLVLTGELLSVENFDWHDGVIVGAMDLLLAEEQASLRLPPNLKRIILPLPLYVGTLLPELQTRIDELSAQSGIKLELENIGEDGSIDE